MKDFGFCEVVGCRPSTVLDNKVLNTHFLKTLLKFKQHISYIEHLSA